MGILALFFLLGTLDPTLAAIPAIIGAMGLILKTVLNALREQREAFEKFLGNHMSKNTATLERLASGVEKNTETTKDLAKEVEFLGRRRLDER